jgi:pimeloyl-ACP methyl ester carboxylesterase
MGGTGGAPNTVSRAALLRTRARSLGDLAIITAMLLPHDDVGVGPALVLLHAGVADRRMYAQHLQPLADAGLRVLALDLPGYGEARLPDEEHAPHLDVIDTLDQLRIEQAALVGNSFGGAVALRVAAVAPERVSALVIVSSAWEGVDVSPQLAAAWEAESSALQNGDVAAATAAVVDAWTLPDASAEIRALVADMQSRAFATQLAGPEPREGADPLEDDPSLLRSLRMPALVLVGEHDMPDFHLAADAFARELPDARRETLAGAGHLAPLETPERFRELVLGLVR